MRAALISGLCIALLSGCATTGSPGGSTSPPSLVPVSAVVNALKCELAETFIKRPDLRERIVDDEKGADIKASLQLKNVGVNYRSGGGGATIPLLGIELGPSVALSRSEATTEMFDVDFSYDVVEVVEKPAFCDNPKLLKYPQDPEDLPFLARVEGDPFIDILDATVWQYERLGAGAPKVKLSALTHTRSFAVEDDKSGGLNAKLIIFSLNAKTGRKATESQQLKLVFGLKFDPKLYNP